MKQKNKTSMGVFHGLAYLFPYVIAFWGVIFLLYAWKTGG